MTGSPAEAPERSGTAAMSGSGCRSMRRLRIAALIEGTTLVALTGIAVPLKHLADVPVAVSVLGPLHGMAFIAYLWLVAATVSDGGWSRREICVTVVSSLVPFGAFLAAGLLKRKAAALAAQVAAVPRSRR